MTDMIAAHEAQKIAQRNALINTTRIEKYVPMLNKVVQEAAGQGLEEVNWDCAHLLSLDEDAKDLVKLQVYLQSLGYEATIVIPRDDFEDDDFDYYYIHISWKHLN